MKPQFFSTSALALALLAGPALASNNEPSLDWTIQRLDATGEPLRPAFTKGRFDEANSQMRVLCDQEMAARMKWPQAAAVRVTVRPFMAKPDDPRMRAADIPCDEVRANKNALESRISRPKGRPTQEKKLIQLWD